MFDLCLGSYIVSEIELLLYRGLKLDRKDCCMNINIEDEMDKAAEVGRLSTHTTTEAAVECS